ncbi:MAG: hypothetical protein QF645_00920 [Planctomycetota bacterium]|jgi:hypothetical protein|nr:hypothetical protein [Planctomycetota bacterium]
MALGSLESVDVAGLAQITPQQVAITRRSTELVAHVMVEIVGGRNNPEEGLPPVRNNPQIESGVGANVDFIA